MYLKMWRFPCGIEPHNISTPLVQDQITFSNYVVLCVENRKLIVLTIQKI